MPQPRKGAALSGTVPYEHHRPAGSWGAGRIVALVVGILAGLLAFALLAGGCATLVIDRVARDDDGYLTSGTERFSSAGYAIVSQSVDIDAETPTWVFSNRAVGDVRVRAEATDGQPVFVGIGLTDDVRAYLDGVAHDEVTDLDFGPFRPTYRPFPGGEPDAPPGEQDFWVSESSGTGVQTATWDVERGDWSVVVMNADGSQGLDVRASAGVELGALSWIAIVLLAAGLLFLVVSAVLLVVAVRARGGPGAFAAAPAGVGAGVTAVPPSGVTPAAPAVAPDYPVGVRGELQPHLSRWLWLVKWILAIPHYVVLWFLWIAFFVLTVVAFFAILFTGRYPRGIFDFNVGVVRWTWRVMFYSYWALGTDRYPPFSLEPDPEYAADFAVAYPERLHRGLVLVKWWLLAIPHYIIVAIFVGGGFGWGWGWNWWAWDEGWGGGWPGLVPILVIVAAVVLVFTARYPRGIFDFVLGLDRWVLRVIPYAALMRDEYPPFRLDTGPREAGEPVPAEEPPPATR